jgi:hypothetical protein
LNNGEVRNPPASCYGKAPRQWEYHVLPSLPKEPNISFGNVAAQLLSRKHQALKQKSTWPPNLDPKEPGNPGVFKGASWEIPAKNHCF